MKRFVVLLRGINISGKNKISMAELKQGLEALGFDQVKTYLNSGNALFSSEEGDAAVLENQIAHMIRDTFHLDIPVLVLPKDAILDILDNAPEWWGKDSQEIYHNLIFILPPKRFEDVYNEIGAPKEGLERIQAYENVIFWSFSRKEYQKTHWWPQTARATIGGRLTIRTANTLRKLAALE